MSSDPKIDRLVALGRRRYVVRYGVVGWGLTTAAAFTGWNYYTKGHLQPLEIVIALVCFPLGGIAWGAFMWNVLKRRHARLTQPDRS